MFIPSGVVVDAIVRVDGTNEIVGIATVTSPDVEGATEEVTGLGLNKFNYVIPGVTNALTLTLKFNGYNKSMRFANARSVSLVINAAIGGQDTDNHEQMEIPYRINCKGAVSKRPGAELGKGTKVEPEMTLELTKYMVTIDGVTDIDIDVLNNKFIVDQVDLNSTVRNILSQ